MVVVEGFGRKGKFGEVVDALIGAGIYEVLGELQFGLFELINTLFSIVRIGFA